MDKKSVAKLYQEEDIISKKLIIENMLLSKIGIKGCSSITIPSDLKQGKEMAERINQQYQEKVTEYENKFSWRKLALSPRKLVEKAIKHKQQILKKIFNENVYTNEEYLRLISWGRIIGLIGIEYEIRPSIREMLLFPDPERKEEIERLMQFRAIIKKDSKDSFTEKTPVQILLYPEELNPRYVEEIGKLTGYPECCINAFLNDRAKGDNPLMRGTIDYYSAAKTKKPELWAYYTADFVPCRPDCKAAQDNGHKAYQRLQEVDPGIAEDYQQMMADNRASFESQAEKLQSDIVRMQKQNNKK